MENRQYDRQQLLDDVWSTPVTHLTQSYELSDAGLKKLCSRLQIPTPPRGYWAKLKAGKKVPPKPTLVPAQTVVAEHPGLENGTESLYDSVRRPHDALVINPTGYTKFSTPP